MSIKKRIQTIVNDDKTTEEDILHQLLELAMGATGRGYISDDYTKFIEFDIGNITVLSDPYYNVVQIDEQDMDSESVQKIIEEVKKRLLRFDEKIKAIREEVAAEVFDEPMKELQR